MRELILESWSLFISQSDQEYYSKIQSDRKQSKIVTYETFLNNKLNNVKEILKMIIPQDNSENQYDIVSTFMHIFDFVTGMYERRIMSSFPKKISNCYSSNDSDRFCSLFVGFKPYSLYNKSGSRINLLDDDSHEPEFISDPELKYVMKSQNKLKSFVISITQKIDDIFNKLCKKINDVIVCYMGLKFFLRRTLGGCEFGLCFDFELENINEKTCKDFNCLIDKDPLLVFTINVKSMAPIIAGILIIGLVYIAKVASQIAQLISGINIDIAGKVVKKVAKIVIEKIADTLLQNQIEQFVSQVCMFLINAINNQILILKSYNPDLAYIFDLLMLIADVDDFSKCDEKINQLFEGFTFVKMNSSFKQKSKPIKGIFKIGFLLMIAFGSFMMNFQYRHKALKYKTQKVAEDYDKNQKTDEAVTANEKFVQLDVTEN